MMEFQKIFEDIISAFAQSAVENQNLNCTICGLSMNSGGIGLKTADGTAIHMECLEENCVSTDCYSCQVQEYDKCAFLDMKGALINGGGN